MSFQQCFTAISCKSILESDEIISQPLVVGNNTCINCKCSEIIIDKLASWDNRISHQYKHVDILKSDVIP